MMSYSLLHFLFLSYLFTQFCRYWFDGLLLAFDTFALEQPSPEGLCISEAVFHAFAVEDYDYPASAFDLNAAREAGTRSVCDSSLYSDVKLRFLLQELMSIVPMDGFCQHDLIVSNVCFFLFLPVDHSHLLHIFHFLVLQVLLFAYLHLGKKTQFFIRRLVAESGTLAETRHCFLTFYFDLALE